MHKLSSWALIGLTVAAPFALVAPAVAQRAAVPMATPQQGRVTLANGNVWRGLVTVDDPGRRVTVRNGDRQEIVPFDRLGRINYDRGAVVYARNGSLVFRGESNGTPVSRAIEVSWGDFSTTDEGLGQVQVMLSRTFENRGILAVAEDTQYVVDEIVFDPEQQRMVIRATAY